MVAYSYQDVAACTTTRYRTRFCANVPASFKVYPSILPIQSSHLLTSRTASRSFARYLSFQSSLFQGIHDVFICVLGTLISAYIWSSAAMLLNFKLVSTGNKGIRPSLRLRHLQNLCVTFVLKPAYICTSHHYHLSLNTA